VKWVAGDVASLATLGFGDDRFNLVHDRGCFHELSTSARDGYAPGVSELVAPDATLLLMAFARREHSPGRCGACRESGTGCDGCRIAES
jgi:hypothetical protein